MPWINLLSRHFCYFADIMESMQPKRPQKPDRRRPMEKAKGMTGMAMGVIYILVGIFMFFAQQRNLLGMDKTFTYIVASLIILYGAFRIWRGQQLRKSA